MAQIVVHNLQKTFKVARRQAGLWQAMRGLVKREYTLVRALDGVSFEIQEGAGGLSRPQWCRQVYHHQDPSGILLPDGETAG